MSAASAAATTDSLLDSATCAICLDICKRPCSVPCGHNMCQRCLRNLYLQTAGSKQCPTCRSALPSSLADVKVNHTLEQMISFLITMNPARGPSSASVHPFSALRLPLLPLPVPDLTSPFHALLGGFQLVLKQVHPDLSITLMGARILASMMADTLDRVASSAGRLCAMQGRTLVTDGDVSPCVQSFLDGELAKHAVKECTKAVQAFHEGVKKNSGLQFSPFSTAELLRGCCPALNFTTPAMVSFTALMEYISAELLELAGNAAKDLKSKILGPRHVLLAVRGDEELDNLNPGIIAYGGIVPRICTLLLERPFLEVQCEDFLFGKLDFTEEAKKAEFALKLKSASFMDDIKDMLKLDDEATDEDKASEGHWHLSLKAGQALYSLASGAFADTDEMAALVTEHMEPSGSGSGSGSSGSGSGSGSGSSSSSSSAQAAAVPSAEVSALETIMSLYTDTVHGMLAQADIQSPSTLFFLHPLTQGFPSDHGGVVESEKGGEKRGGKRKREEGRGKESAALLPPPAALTLGDALHSALCFPAEDLKGPGLNGLEAAFTSPGVGGGGSGSGSGSGSGAGAAGSASSSVIAALGHWAEKSAAATAAFSMRVHDEVAALASAKTPAELSTASSWFKATPTLQQTLQPYSPTAQDAAHNLHCQLQFPVAALEDFCELLSAHSDSFERAEGKLKLGKGRCAAALASAKASKALVEAAKSAGALPSLLDRGRVEAALVEIQALLPRVCCLAGDSKGHFGEAAGEEEEPELEDDDDSPGLLPERLKRALTVLGSPPTSGPSLTARPVLPPEVLSTLQPTVASFRALLAERATGGLEQDLEIAAEGWKAVARAYAKSSDRELRVRAACYYGEVQLARIREAQIGLMAGPLHGFLSHSGRQREEIRCASTAGSTVPNVIPYANFALLVEEISHDLSPGLTFAPDAFEALRCAAEDHLTCMFDEANLYAVHSRREAVEVSDIRLAKHIRRQHQR